MIKVSVMRLSWKEFDYLLKLELDENDYTVSRCRDFIDKHFTNTNLNNRPITRLLPNHYINIERKGNKIFKTGKRLSWVKGWVPYKKVGGGAGTPFFQIQPQISPQ